MSAAPPAPLPPSRLPAAWAVAAAWVLYLPVGLQYLLVLAGTAWVLVQRGRARDFASLLAEPLLRSWWPFCGWMLLSAAWTSATAPELAAHLWHYALPLALPVLALALQADDARRAMRHFVAASIVAALVLPSGLAEQVTGNQRVLHSLLLSIATALACAELMAHAPLPRHHRAAWAAAALVCMAGLALQDRRTGMLALPLLLAALAWVRWQRWPQRLLGVALVLATLAAVGWSSSTVRHRIAEGWQELQQYQPHGAVETSWGMRLRLYEASAEMVRERPWVGHGVGAWLGRWRASEPRGELLQAHTTPHNEYLLITVQAGAVGLVLFLGALAVQGLAAWRAAAGGRPQALVIWIAFAFAALFNVALRDAKLALPLLLLAAFGWAIARAAPPR